MHAGEGLLAECSSSPQSTSCLLSDEPYSPGEVIKPAARTNVIPILLYAFTFLEIRAPYAVQFLCNKARLLSDKAKYILCGAHDSRRSIVCRGLYRWALRPLFFLLILLNTVVYILGSPWVKIGSLDYLDKWDYKYEWPIPKLDSTTNIVTVDIYDLGYSWTLFNNLAMKYQMGAFHTEINVYDEVFRYQAPPPLDEEGYLRKDWEGTDGMPYRGRLTLGRTLLNQEEVHDLKTNDVRHNQLLKYGRHEVLENNCNDLSAYVAENLGLGWKWPFWVDDFPKALGYYAFDYYDTLVAGEELFKNRGIWQTFTNWREGHYSYQNQQFYRDPLHIHRHSHWSPIDIGLVASPEPADALDESSSTEATTTED